VVVSNPPEVPVEFQQRNQRKKKKREKGGFAVSLPKELNPRMERVGPKGERKKKKKKRIENEAPGIDRFNLPRSTIPHRGRRGNSGGKNKVRTEPPGE